MKRVLKWMGTLLLAALLVWPLPVRADVIYEPMDSFYEMHRNDCVYVGRSYTANGPNGTVTVYESPESDEVEAVLQNGETVYISYTYSADGVNWGCCDEWNAQITGWVPMDYLELIYDGISFSEEYGDQFVDVNGTLGGAYQGKTIYLWQYPGSKEYGTFDWSGGGDYSLNYSEEYTDAEGNRWGWCAYFMGYKGYWINLDDPTANYETLFPERTEETQPRTETPESNSAAVDEIVPKTPQSERTVKRIVIAAVAAVVAVTCVLLFCLKRKK